MDDNAEVAAKRTLGLRLNQYVLTEEIGRGGHGTVYLAFHEDRPNEVVAVKVIDDTGNLDVLLVEPELLSRLQHPNIVTLRDYFLHAGKLVLVMEYIDGPDLRTYLEQKGSLTPAEIKTFLTQMASALAHSHANNIIHRDVKPSNILVKDDWNNQRYVLVDFGISRMAEGVQLIRRAAGTYHYMAPEQLRGRPTGQSDLWAIGVISYMLLTGSIPFEGDTKEDLSKKILYSIPPLPSTIVSETDPDLERIVYHLLEKQPVNRTASAEELLAEVEEWPALSSQEYRSEPGKSRTSKPSTLSWEQRNKRATKKNWILFWIFVFLAIVPSGIVGGAMGLGGAILFSQGQRPPQSKSRTIGGFVIMLLGIFVMLLFGAVIGAILAFFLFMEPEEIETASGIYNSVTTIFITIPFILLAVNYFVKARQLEREAFLLRTLRTGSVDVEKLTEILRDFVDTHMGDMNVHQKYVETLLLLGRGKEAVVEAKRIIDIDPYNSGATLLLAHGYFDLGLYKECVMVCDSYLSVSGYSFEFADLRERCTELLGGNNEV